MPNKTIYVSDDDLPLYKRAQELAGNLSSAISIALRKYVELEEGRLEGYDEITVRVGPGAGRKQRFSGVLLAEGGRASKYGLRGLQGLPEPDRQVRAARGPPQPVHRRRRRRAVPVRMALLGRQLEQ